MEKSQQVLTDSSLVKEKRFLEEDQSDFHEAILLAASCATG